MTLEDICKWNKPDIEWGILYDLTYTWNVKKVKLIEAENRAEISRDWEGGEYWAKGTTFNYKMTMFMDVIYSIEVIVYTYCTLKICQVIGCYTQKEVTVRWLMGVPINFIMVIISQCVYILNYHILHVNIYICIYTCQFYLNKAVSYNPIKLGVGNEDSLLQDPKKDITFC